jgi:undecaprenyl-diphosphatase
LQKIKISNTNLIILLTGIILFCLISFAVVSGRSAHIDNSILLLLRNTGNASIPVGPGWFLDFMQDISSLGSVTAVILITVLISGLLIIKKEYITLNSLLTTIIGGGLIELLMKEIFSRPRPQIIPHLVTVYSFSFPSGHSAISTIVYLALAFLIFKFEIKRSIKLYFLISAVFLILLIGFSRVYLGVHYPTDVLGGWTLGLTWISSRLLFSNKFKRN